VTTSRAAGEARPRTLVIGGTGFLGRHVCAEFEAARHELLVVARDPSRHQGDLPFISLDLARPSAVPELIKLLEAERPDVVVNAAGAVWAPTERQLRECNVDLVRNLVTAIAAVPARPRLVQLGSVNEYAEQPPGAAVTEDTLVRPVTRYGQSKAAGSAAVLGAMSRGRLEGLVLRIANVAGPGLPSVSLLGRVAEQLHAAERESRPAVVRLYPMRAHRDFLDYRDAARAIRLAATARASRRAINIGSGAAASVRSLVTQLIAVTGTAAEILEVAAGPGSARPEAEWLRVDVRTAGELLGWSPDRQLADSMRDLWEHVTSGR
jgi:nucleoside-diphosphate-sugar epimerase